jgi:hypothetical protein
MLELPTKVAYVRLESLEDATGGVRVFAFVDETDGPHLTSVIRYRINGQSLVIDEAQTMSEYQNAGYGKCIMGSILKAAYESGITEASSEGLMSTSEVIARGAIKLPDGDVTVPMPGQLFDWLMNELSIFEQGA